MCWHTMKEENEAWERAKADAHAEAEHDANMKAILQSEHDEEMRAEYEREKKLNHILHPSNRRNNMQYEKMRDYYEVQCWCSDTSSWMPYISTEFKTEESAINWIKEFIEHPNSVSRHSMYFRVLHILAKPSSRFDYGCG